MLARSSKPFDSDRYLFEIKWDGMRALAFVESDKYRLTTRRKTEISSQFPEFGFLSRLPAGAILDGEIVILRDGLPDFGALLSRAQTNDVTKISNLSRRTPATYVVFDVLYKDYDSIIDMPLIRRREVLQKIVDNLKDQKLVFSDGIVGTGNRYYEAACRKNLEGVMAKRLDSRYVPGKRRWLKIKRFDHAYCVIIGFVPKGDGFKSLLLATNDDGELKYVGKVSTGFSMTVRRKLNSLLKSLLRGNPIIECSEKAIWIEPELCCSVKHTERTPAGRLRMPVFETLILE